MRFPLAYYLLLLYSTVMLKPLIPVVEDNIEHCFAEAYHIATVHAIYGNDHLEKEMADSNDNNNNKNILKDEDNVPVHIATDNYNPSFETPMIFIKYSTANPLFLSKVFPGKNIPPPKIS